MSEIRYDRLHDRHVIIAPERLHRPSCEVREKERRHTSRSCPFCEGNESLTPSEIFALRPDDSLENTIGWKTRVVPNLYKAVQIETPYEQHFGMFEYWDGFGAHEVLIDTPEHYTSITQWSEEHVYNWLKTLQVRINDLRQDERLRYVSLFKNEGESAGGTQPHSHTQIIGLPIVPKEKREEYERLYEYYKYHQTSLISAMLDEELDAKEHRHIASYNEFSAYCPYASSHPFEVMITSKEALGDIDSLSEDSMKSVAPLLLLVIKKLQLQLNCLEYNVILSTPPLQEKSVSSELYHVFHDVGRFYLRIIPRVYKYGGFEHDSGIYINPVAPELAAKLLREC